VAARGLEGEELEVFGTAYLSAEKLRRGYDACPTSDRCAIAMYREYRDLDGPHIPCAGGYQVSHSNLSLITMPRLYGGVSFWNLDRDCSL
jgi:hypothetical protein